MIGNRTFLGNFNYQNIRKYNSPVCVFFLLWMVILMHDIIPHDHLKGNVIQISKNASLPTGENEKQEEEKGVLDNLKIVINKPQVLQFKISIPTIIFYKFHLKDLLLSIVGNYLKIPKRVNDQFKPPPIQDGYCLKVNYRGPPTGFL